MKTLRVRLTGYHLPPRCRKPSHVSIILGSMPVPEGLPLHPGDFKAYQGPEKADFLASLDPFRQQALAKAGTLKAPSSLVLRVTELETEEGSPFETETLFGVHAEALEVQP